MKSPEVRIPAREQRDLALWNTLGMASMADVDAVVQVRNLDFRFDSRLPFVLRDVSMDVPRGSRTLLIGANGAGKSSLMRILAGRHFHSPSKCQIFGRPAFHDTSLGRIVALLGERWGYETMGDITVEKLVNGLETPDWDRIEQLTKRGRLILALQSYPGEEFLVSTAGAAWLLAFVDEPRRHPLTHFRI